MTDVTTFDGTRLALQTWGPAEAPVLVLVHGLGMSSRSWGRVPELLSREHRVISYDLRGHAQSGDATTGDYSMQAQAQDLDAVLRDVVPEGRRAVVVGSSFGGGVILSHADLFGTERVAGAVFAGSGGSGVTFPGFPARGVPRRAQHALRWGWLKTLRGIALVGRRIRRAEIIADRIVRRLAFTPDSPQEAVEHVRESFLSSRPEALARTMLASVSHDARRLGPRLRVPTLVLHGTADPEVPEEDLRMLLSELADPELVSVPGAGHFLPLTHPELVAEQVARWVRHVGPDQDRNLRPAG